MTDDLVARLRSPEVFIDTGGMFSPVAHQAADEIERLRAREAAARREGIEAAAAIAGNWNIPSVDKPRHILALLKEPSHD